MGSDSSEEERRGEGKETGSRRGEEEELNTNKLFVAVIFSLPFQHWFSYLLENKQIQNEIDKDKTQTNDIITN